MIEFHMLDLAMEEIKSGQKLWEYFDHAVEENNHGKEGSCVENTVQDDRIPGQRSDNSMGSSEDSSVSMDCESEEAVRVQTGETGIVVWLDEETKTKACSV